MSSARTSPGSEQTRLSASPVSTVSSSVSTISLPGPTHTPSQTPVIAGSLAGVIVLVVCLVTLLLLHKRRLRLRAERILRATQQYSSSPNISGNNLHKRRSLNVYEERPPPRTQDSASSSGSYAPSPSGVSPPTHTTHPLHQLPHNKYPPDSTQKRRRTTSSNRSVRDSQDNLHPLAPASVAIHQPGQSPSSGVRSQKPLLSPSQPHRTTKPVLHTQPPVNIPQMTSESSAPRGHADGAVVDTTLDNNNLVSASPSAIFGNTIRSDAGERRATRQGYDGPKADIPAGVVSRDVSREGQTGLRDSGSIGGRSRGAAGEPRHAAVDGVANEARDGHGNEGGRSGTPGTFDGYNHIQEHTQGGEEDYGDGRQRVEVFKSHASASLSGRSYLTTASGSENIEGTTKSRIGDPDRLEFPPDFTPSTRPTTVVVPGSSPPTSAYAVFASSSLPPPPDVGGPDTQQRNHVNQKTATNTNNTQLVPSTRLGQNRSFHGPNQAPIALSRLGAGISVVEEDAPPAYENAWASAREVTAERRRAEQLEPRTS